MRACKFPILMIAKQLICLFGQNYEFLKMHCGIRTHHACTRPLPQTAIRQLHLKHAYSAVLTILGNYFTNSGYYDREVQSTVILNGISK